MADRPELAEDQWLPQRLASIGFIIEGERRVADEWVRLMDAWLDGVRPRVFNGLGTRWATVDPLGVMSGMARFAELLGGFLENALTWVIGRAYRRVLGQGYEFSNRPWVQQHLQTVSDRLVRTPTMVFDLMRAELDAGINDGESIPELAARIDAELLRGGAERWVNRATVIARTETIGAYNGATNDAFLVLEDELDEPLEKVWLASMDSRTRDSHFAADGQRVPLKGAFTVGGFPAAYPGDPSLPAHEVIQCRCSMLVVEPGEETDMSNRGMRGADAERAEVADRRARGIIRTRDKGI